MTSQPTSPKESRRGFELCPEQLLFTVEEAAEVLRVGRTTIYALIRSGDLRPVHIGRCCRISRGELDRYVARLDAAQSRPPVPIRRREQFDRGETTPSTGGCPQDAA
jgi:excisionase family DNA binding protein